MEVAITGMGSLQLRMRQKTDCYKGPVIEEKRDAYITK